MKNLKILVLEKEKGGEKQYDGINGTITFSSEYITYKTWSNGCWEVLKTALKGNQFDLIYLTMGKFLFEADPSFEKMVGSLLAPSGLFVTPADASVFTEQTSGWMRKTALFNNVIFNPNTTIGDCIEMYYICRTNDRTVVGVIDTLPGVWGSVESDKWQQLKTGGWEPEIIQKKKDSMVSLDQIVSELTQ